uniref:Uncharacterized protein n=1 Tax=Globodera rostochiensis TaxID=31243 RepID=A0A914HUW6_GLORO
MGLNQSKPNKAKQSPSKPVTFTLTPIGRFPHQSDIWQQLQAAEQHGIGLPLPTGNTPPLLQHQQAQIVPPSSSNSNFFMNPLASPEVYSIGSIHQTPNDGGGGYSPIQPDLGNAKTQYEPPNVQINGSAGSSPRQYRADPVSDERPKESPLLCDTNPNVDNAKTKYVPSNSMHQQNAPLYLPISGSVDGFGSPSQYGIEHPVADKSTNGSPSLCDTNPNVDNAKTKYEPPKSNYQIGSKVVTDNTPPLLQHQQALIAFGSIDQTSNGGGGGGYSPIQPDLGNAKTQYEPPNAQSMEVLTPVPVNTAPILSQTNAQKKAHCSATPIRTQTYKRKPIALRHQSGRHQNAKNSQQTQHDKMNDQGNGEAPTNGTEQESTMTVVGELPSNGTEQESTMTVVGELPSNGTEQESTMTVVGELPSNGTEQESTMTVVGELPSNGTEQESTMTVVGELPSNGTEQESTMTVVGELPSNGTEQESTMTVVGELPSNGTEQESSMTVVGELPSNGTEQESTMTVVGELPSNGTEQESTMTVVGELPSNGTEQESSMTVVGELPSNGTEQESTMTVVGELPSNGTEQESTMTVVGELPSNGTEQESSMTVVGELPSNGTEQESSMTVVGELPSNGTEQESTMTVETEPRVEKGNERVDRTLSNSSKKMLGVIGLIISLSLLCWILLKYGGTMREWILWIREWIMVIYEWIVCAHQWIICIYDWIMWINDCIMVIYEWIVCVQEWIIWMHESALRIYHWTLWLYLS